jgi:preprotein translocase subunit SecA
MDDDLMRLFGGANIKGIMTKIGMESGEPIYHPWLNKSIEKAQKKVEEKNFEIRKHLLEYDDVLNQQRKFIYEQRNAILSDGELKARVNDATLDMVRHALGEYSLKRGDEAGLAGYLREKFGYTLRIREGENVNAGTLEAEICGALEQELNEKEALVGSANLNAYIRFQYLQFIDRKWLDHLESMEALREAVYLRSYGQKNPLTEYKIEGFEIFDRMIDSIRQEIASRVHLVRIQQAGERGPRPAMTVQNANHGSIDAFSQGREGQGREGPARSGARLPSQGRLQGRGQGASVTVVRSVPKVGRNDPCPCGSGKKYKHCHGK